MNRRDWFGALTATVLGWLGLGNASASPRFRTFRYEGCKVLPGKDNGQIVVGGCTEVFTTPGRQLYCPNKLLTFLPQKDGWITDA